MSSFYVIDGDDRLRRAIRVREGREPEPTAGVVAAQRRGYGAGKRVNGAKLAVQNVPL